MTATNHALTGTILGLLIGRPLLAVPLALLSHFICDALPHYTSNVPDDQNLTSTSFRRLLYSDMAACVLLVLILALARPEHWLLASICAFTATSPDLAWLPKYLRARRGLPDAGQPNLFLRFAAQIQWFARPIGAFVEIAWFIGASTIIASYL